MINFFKQIAERVRSLKTNTPKPKPGDDGPGLEQTIPMPEVGVGVKAHLMNVRDAEEAERKLTRDRETRDKIASLKQEGVWAEPPNPQTDFAEMADRARESARQNRQAEAERTSQTKRDQGMSM